MREGDSRKPRLVHAPTEPVEAVDASVTIITRDRLAEAERAVGSALRQEGCRIEVIVIDDGSGDGSAEALGRRFEQVAVYRSETPQGPAAQRNFAASVARGDFLVGIDDDAELLAQQTIACTMRDFEAGADIGAVAIPYLERLADGAMLEFHHAQGEEVEVVEQFVAAAYAIRRGLFLRLGGYSHDLYYYGEERDLGVRLLQAGYFVRLGTAPPLIHRPSAIRRSALRGFYGRRNDVLFAWQNVPTPALAVHCLRTTANGMLAAILIEHGAYAMPMLRGLLAGWRSIRRHPRHPLDLDVYRLSLALRRRGPLLLAEARPRLAAARRRVIHAESSMAPDHRPH